MGFSWCSRSSARKTCAGLLKFLPPQTKTFMATVTQMSRDRLDAQGQDGVRPRHRTAALRPGDVMVNPGGSEEHEAWFHKDTEVIDGAIMKRGYLISGSSILLWRLQFLLY